MTEKIIKICGKEVGMAYCAATEQNFEILADKGIAEISPNRQTDLILLGFAAIIAYYQAHGGDAPVQIKDVMYSATPEEITSMILEVLRLRGEWYSMPVVEAMEVGAAQEPSEDSPKN